MSHRNMYRFASMLVAVSAGITAAPLTLPALADTTDIPVIVMDTTSGYWQTVLAGARKAGKELGIKVPELGAQSVDANAQIAILDKAAAGKPAGIVIASSQFEPLGKPIDTAAASTKIVGIDSIANSKSYSSFLGTDNLQGGRVAADQLAEGIKAKTGKIEGNVALVSSWTGVGSLDQRAAGFKEELAAKYPGLKLVADKVADNNAAKAQSIVTDLLASDPNLKGVFASNNMTAIAAGKAVSEADASNKITVVGFDSDVRLVKMPTSGVIYALILQDPFRMGYEGVKTASALSKGEKVAAAIDTGVSAITKDNMASARSQELLSPKLN